MKGDAQAYLDTPTAKLAMKQSKADGVMIGRGAQGKPWLLSQIASEIFNTKPPEIPSGNKLLEMISNHYLEMLNFYGEQHGNKVARKHLGWYMNFANLYLTLLLFCLRQQFLE